MRDWFSLDVCHSHPGPADEQNPRALLRVTSSSSESHMPLFGHYCRSLNCVSTSLVPVDASSPGLTCQRYHTLTPALSCRPCFNYPQRPKGVNSVTKIKSITPDHTLLPPPRFPADLLSRKISIPGFAKGSRSAACIMQQQRRLGSRS